MAGSHPAFFKALITLGFENTPFEFLTGAGVGAADVIEATARARAVSGRRESFISMDGGRVSMVGRWFEEVRGKRGARWVRSRLYTFE